MNLLMPMRTTAFRRQTETSQRLTQLGFANARRAEKMNEPMGRLILHAGVPGGRYSKRPERLF